MPTNNAINTYIVPTIAREVRMPLQPAFLAFLNAAQNNVTGNAAVYTIHFDLEIYDQNADYNNGTYTFTSPVTGKYILDAEISVNDLAAAHTLGTTIIVTSNRNYQIDQINIGAVKNVDNAYTACGGTIADMDAGDTATVTLQISNGILQVDMQSGGIMNYFCGELLV